MIIMFEYLFNSKPVYNLSTGIAELDTMLDNGLPKGRIIELFGPSDCGKTAFILYLIKQVQVQNGIVLYINVDNNINLEYLRHNDINLEELCLLDTNNMEIVLSSIEQMCQHKVVDLIIIDTVTNLITEQEQNNSMYYDNNFKIDFALRKIAQYIYGTNATVVCVNQHRARKINNEFVIEDAWKNLFSAYASIRIRMKKKDCIFKDNDIVGFNTVIEIIKNKLNSKTGKIVFPINFYKGDI